MAKALHLLAKRLDSYLKPGAVRFINRGSSALCGQVWRCGAVRIASACLSYAMPAVGPLTIPGKGTALGVGKSPVAYISGTWHLVDQEH